MKYFIKDLYIEVTRRCNLRCDHCMRGESQNCDVTKEQIDTLLEKLKDARIENVIFTGGEPTLNPNVIVYTIKRVMDLGLNVDSFQMVTNGQIFSEPIARAFDIFNDYYESMTGRVPYRRYAHAIIAFSVDPHHASINKGVVDAYELTAPHTIIEDHCVPEEDIIQTGFATYGQEYSYSIPETKYWISKRGDRVTLLNELYLTANGLMTNNGIGEYTAMDKMNLGRVEDFSLEELLLQNGSPTIDSRNISELLEKPVERQMTPKTQS